jgi:Cytochrome P450
MAAGHETTANAISWTLYSLSLHPKVQNELREEIKATRARAVLRGDAELTAADLDSMRLLVAVLKVRSVLPDRLNSPLNLTCYTPFRRPLDFILFYHKCRE